MDQLQEKIWAAALKHLELRIHSLKELKEKLVQKFPQEEGRIENVLEEMQRLQLLNDRRFTEEFLRHLIQKNIGRLKILYETRKKGLPLNLVEQGLLDLEWSEEASAQKALAEKERVLGTMEPRKKKQKLLSFLRNRGFGDQIIYQLLKD